MMRYTNYFTCTINRFDTTSIRVAHLARLRYNLDTTWILLVLGYNLDTTWILLGYNLDTIWILLGYNLDTTWILLGYYFDPCRASRSSSMNAITGLSSNGSGDVSSYEGKSTG